MKMKTGHSDDGILGEAQAVSQAVERTSIQKSGDGQDLQGRQQQGQGVLDKRGRPTPFQELSFISMVEELSKSVILSVDGTATTDLVGRDPLFQHIASSNLQLEQFGDEVSNGNCFYVALWNLCIFHQVQLPSDVNNPHDLRLAIVASIVQHPQFGQGASEAGSVWFRDVFGSQHRRVSQFQRLHSTDGSYTDNMGIILFAAQNLLRVSINVVATSNNIAHPVTNYPYGGPGEPVALLTLGYYQVTPFPLQLISFALTCPSFSSLLSFALNQK